MRNPTELSKAILTSPTAQKLIDYVSPVYGNSYVGLWLLQAIGTIFDDVVVYAEQLRYEANPITSVLLLDLWEQHYNLPKDNSLTTEQRQARLAAKLRSKGPSNPARLAEAISSSMGGVEVGITENVDINTFLVVFMGNIGEIIPAIDMTERRKQAHLIYRMCSDLAAGAELKIASALTHSEKHEVETDSLFYESADAILTMAAAVTHSEKYTVEVLN